MAKFYRVGGDVRDLLLNIKSKDVDFVVEASSYEDMKQAIIARGCDIKTEKPEFVTIRAVDAKLGGVDFVLARKDGTYLNDGRRPDFIEVGTLYDDLARRDATINAMAIDEVTGELIDPFGGRADLTAGVLRCVGVARARFCEDSLRLLRFARFCVTKGFTLDAAARECLLDSDMVGLLSRVSSERISDELNKMFRYNTLQTLRFFDEYKTLRDFVFSGKVWLMPTLKNN